MVLLVLYDFHLQTLIFLISILILYLQIQYKLMSQSQIYFIQKDPLMFNTKLILISLLITLLTIGAQTRRLTSHYQNKAPEQKSNNDNQPNPQSLSTQTTFNQKTKTQTSNSDTTTTTTPTTSPVTPQQTKTQTNAEPNSKQTSTESSKEQTVDKKSPETQSKNDSVEITSKIQEQSTANSNKVSQNQTPAPNSQNVPIQDLRTMTSSQLALNLSNLEFPTPKAQGDTLNISSILISKVSNNQAIRKCKDGYYTPISSNTCKLADILLQVNLDANNLIIGDLNLQDLKQKQNKFKKEYPNFTTIDCQNQTPFLSKSGCIACKDPSPYFSLKSLKCSHCPKGANYNGLTKNCQTDGYSYVSNLNAKNFLVLPGQSFDDVKKQIEDAQKNPAVRVCPQNRPYSNGSQCISCPEDKPLFFISGRVCTSCQQGTTYDASIHSCLGKKFRVTTITKSTISSSSERENKDESSQQFKNKKQKQEEKKQESSSDEKKKGDNEGEDNKKDD